LKPDRHRQACLEEVARVLRPGHPFIFSRHDPWGGWGRRRVLRAARLWRGAGYAHDPSHGGMDTHFATPEYVTRELARSGLNVVDVLRAGRGRRPPWWYYAALRAP
jgi:SAM-dependent methyltransferase